MRPPGGIARPLARSGFRLRLLRQRIGHALPRAIVVIHLPQRDAHVRKSLDRLVQLPRTIEIALGQPQDSALPRSIADLVSCAPDSTPPSRENDIRPLPLPFRADPAQIPDAAPRAAPPSPFRCSSANKHRCARGPGADRANAASATPRSSKSCLRRRVRIVLQILVSVTQRQLSLRHSDRCGPSRSGA